MFIWAIELICKYFKNIRELVSHLFRKKNKNIQYKRSKKEDIIYYILYIIVPNVTCYQI